MRKIFNRLGGTTASAPSLSKAKAASIAYRIVRLEREQKKLIQARHVAPEPYSGYIEQREKMITRSIKHLKGSDDR